MELIEKITKIFEGSGLNPKFTLVRDGQSFSFEGAEAVAIAAGIIVGIESTKKEVDIIDNKDSLTQLTHRE